MPCAINCEQQLPLQWILLMHNWRNAAILALLHLKYKIPKITLRLSAEKYQRRLHIVEIHGPL